MEVSSFPPLKRSDLGHGGWKPKRISYREVRSARRKKFVYKTRFHIKVKRKRKKKINKALKLEFQYFDSKNAMQKTNVEKNHRAIQSEK